MKLNQNDKSFIANTITTLNKYKFSLLLINKKSLNNNNLGIFSQENKSITIATNNPTETWFTTIIHEFNHFLQFTNNNKEYLQLANNPKIDNSMNLWINNPKEFPYNSNTTKSIIAYQNMEINCEQNTINTILKLKLSPNIKKYTNNANLYIASFSSLIYFKQNIITNHIQNKQLLQILPNNFIISNHKQIPNEYFKFIKENIINKK